MVQTFNIADDTGIFAQERYRIQLFGFYLFLAYTGCRAGELVDNERKLNQDDELTPNVFDPKSLGVLLPEF